MASMLLNNNDPETADIIKKLEIIVDKILQDLNKKSSESVRDHVTIIKTYHGRLVQCTSEIEIVFRRLNQNDLGSLFTCVVECFTNIHQKLIKSLEKPKSKPAEIPLEYATQRKTKFSSEDVQNSQPQKTQEQLSRYSQFSVTQYKIQFQKRGDIFTHDTQKKNSALFGGFEVYSEASTQQALFSGVQSPKENIKKRSMRNVRTVATDTNEDMKAMMSGIFLSEKQLELQMIEDMNEMNRMEIDRALKLKFVWKDMVPSGASDKIQDMHKQMNKVGFQQSQFINEQEYLQALSGNSQLSEYFKIQQELMEAIHLVQDKTAKRILKMANEKLRDFLRNQLKEQLKKSKNKKGDPKKQKTLSKLDLEQALNQRTQDLLNKESQIQQLLMRYETNERRLSELMHQLDQYKEKMEIIEAQNEEFFSVQKDANNFDIGIQVSIPDAFLNALQEQLQHQIEATEQSKLILSEQQEQNRQVTLKEIVYSNIHRAMDLLVSVDQKARIKVQGMQAILDILKTGDFEELALQSPDDILHQIMTKIQFNHKKKGSQIEPTFSVADSESQIKLNNVQRKASVLVDNDSKRGEQGSKGSTSPIKKSPSIMEPASSRVNTAKQGQKEVTKQAGRSSSMKILEQNGQQKLDQIFNQEKQYRDKNSQGKPPKGKSDNSQKVATGTDSQYEEGNVEDSRAQGNTRQMRRKAPSRINIDDQPQVIAGQPSRFSAHQIENQNNQYAFNGNNIPTNLLDIDDEGRFQTRTTERNLLDSDFMQKFKQQNLEQQFQNQDNQKSTQNSGIRKQTKKKTTTKKPQEITNRQKTQQGQSENNEEISNNQYEFNNSYQINNQSIYVLDKEAQTTQTTCESQETQTDLDLLQDLYFKLQKEKYFTSFQKDDIASSDRMTFLEPRNDKTSFLSIVRNKQDQGNNKRILIDSQSKKSFNEDSKQKPPPINNIDQQEFGLLPDNIADENNFEEQVLKDLGLKEFDLLPDKDILKHKNVVKKLYERYQQTTQSEWNRQLTIKITKYLSLKEQNGITFEAFLIFISKYVSVHKQCGDFCIHLKRFFNKLGFTSKYWSKRRILNPTKQQPNPFGSTMSQMTQSLSLSTPKGFSSTQFLFRK